MKNENEANNPQANKVSIFKKLGKIIHKIIGKIQQVINRYEELKKSGSTLPAKHLKGANDLFSQNTRKTDQHLENMNKDTRHA